MPAYNVFRILFYLYLFHPKTNGAAFIYDNYLKKKIVEIQNYLDIKGKQAWFAFIYIKH